MNNDTATTPRRMRCGCGFELVGADATIEVFNEHVCTEVEQAPRWHESVFSPAGIALLVIAAMVIAMLAGAK